MYKGTGSIDNDYCINWRIWVWDWPGHAQPTVTREDTTTATFWEEHLTVVTEHTLIVRFLTDRVLTGRQRVMAGVRSAGRSATAECRARSRLGEQQTLLSVGLASVHTCCFLWTCSSHSNYFCLNICHKDCLIVLDFLFVLEFGSTDCSEKVK